TGRCFASAKPREERAPQQVPKVMGARRDDRQMCRPRPAPSVGTDEEQTKEGSMPVVEITDLRKTYGGRAVVDGVSVAVERGEIFGVLGRNGAGKTTTIECALGLRRPDGGRVRVFGLDP